MIELHIKSKGAWVRMDLTDDIDISITYTSLDTTSPSSVNNSYSVDVNLPATKTNNEVFGGIYNIDSNTLDQFDPNLRTDFLLMDNGSIVEQGYLQMNQITKNGDNISYRITLFGGLGSFFYNLMYKEDGSELGLKDLYYGWKETPEKEKSETLTTWDVENITTNWSTNLGYDFKVQEYNLVDLPIEKNRINVILRNWTYMTPGKWVYSIPNNNDNCRWVKDPKTGEELKVCACDTIDLNPYMGKFVIIPNSIAWYHGKDTYLATNPVLSSASRYDNYHENNTFFYTSNDFDDPKYYHGIGGYRVDKSMRFLYLNLYMTNLLNNAKLIVSNNQPDDLFYLPVPYYLGEVGPTDYAPKLLIDFNKIQLGKPVEYISSKYDDIGTYLEDISNSEFDLRGMVSTFYSGYHDEEGTVTGFALLDKDRNVIYAQSYDPNMKKGEFYNHSVYIQENAKYLAFSSSWEYLIYPNVILSYKVNTNLINPDITAIPTYNGYLDDFDNDKIILNTSSFSTNEYLKELELNEGDYHTYKTQSGNNYAIATLPREVSGWEIKNLVTDYIKPGVRISSVIDAISNYSECDVTISPTIKFSEWYQNGFMLLNTMDLNKLDSTVTGGESVPNGIEISLMNEPISLTNSSQIYMDLNVQSILDREVTGVLDTSCVITNLDEKTSTLFFSGYEIRVNAFHPSNLNRVVWTSGSIFHTNTSRKLDVLGFKEYVTSQLGFSVVENLNLDYKDKVVNAHINNLLYVVSPLDDVIFKVNVSPVACYLRYEGRTPISFSSRRTNELYTNSGFHYATPILYTNISYSLEVTYDLRDQKIDVSYNTDNLVNKDMLFGETDNAFKYLIDFTKMFNLKYVYDPTKKEVQILTLDEYYLHDEEPTVLLVDEGSHTTTPTNIDSKYIRVGLEGIDSYVNKIDPKYGEKTIELPYNINKETKDLLEDNVYKNVPSYRYNSIFFWDDDETKDIPRFLRSPSLSLTLFKDSKIDKSKTFDNSVTGQWNINQVRTRDTYEKLCTFQDDLSTIDEVNTFCFFSGREEDFIISQKNQITQTLNKNQCYYFSLYSDENCKTGVTIPLFNKTKDQYSFNMYDDKTNNLYNCFWKSYLEDIYSPKSKKVEVSAHFTDEPHNILRKFYWWNNSLWVVVELKQFNKNRYFNKAVLLKVQDKENYKTHITY